MDAWLREAGLWFTGRHNLISLETPAERSDLRWWFSAAGALLNTAGRTNYFTLAPCLFFLPFFSICFRHYRVKSPLVILFSWIPNPAWTFHLSDDEHWVSITILAADEAESRVSPHEKEHLREKYWFLPWQNFMYSPIVFALRNAHHLPAICALGDLKLGYRSVRKKEMLRLAPLPHAFPLLIWLTHKQWINRRNLRRGKAFLSAWNA